MPKKKLRCGYEIAGICSKDTTKDAGIIKCDYKNCKFKQGHIEELGGK